MNISWAVLCLGLFLLAGPAAAAVQQSQRSGSGLSVGFKYMISDFTGPVRSQWARLDFDPEFGELYTFSQGSNEIHIYNRQGMEVFSFGGDGDIVPAIDIAVGGQGFIFVLSRNFQRDGIQVLDYRGRLEKVLHVEDLPKEFRTFVPDRIEFKNGLLYLLDSGEQQVVSIFPDGSLNSTYDLGPEIEAVAGSIEDLTPEKRMSLSYALSGFSIGDDGAFYFTVPTLFLAFRYNPDGSLDNFGVSGSGPGKFAVVSGITSDSAGRIYIADRLRSVVMIFDREFIFQGEFGYRGSLPEDMIVPDDLAIDPDNHQIFVAQAANKGVGVYWISLPSSQ